MDGIVIDELEAAELTRLWLPRPDYAALIADQCERTGLTTEQACRRFGRIEFYPAPGGQDRTWIPELGVF